MLGGRLQGLRGIRPSKANASLLLFGLVLLLVACIGHYTTIDGTQIGKDAPWWAQFVLVAIGLVAVIWAVLASRTSVEQLWTTRGFLGLPPGIPSRFVQRPDLSEAVVAALIEARKSVALTGIGGVGKSTLAARACEDHRVQRRFRDGVTWLDCASGRDPVSLLADLARRLGLPDAASGFTTVVEGRDKIGTALRGKRILVALDNVWERGTLDAFMGLGFSCTVIFTTRLPEIARTFGATEVHVNELSQQQALELLNKWTGPSNRESTPDAQRLCARVGNLALGVAMAGAMIASGRSLADVLGLIEQDLSRVKADLNPEYPYRTLFAAIEAGIAGLSVENQQRYVQLAAFARRGPFPRTAAWALWQPGVSEAETADLLADLAGRSLLSAYSEGWYVTHDLQCDILTRRLGVEGLAKAHSRLLDGYSAYYPDGWAESGSDSYLSRTLAGHLHDAGRHDELNDLLSNVNWIAIRLASGQFADLAFDYSLTEDPLCREIGRALRLSAHILAANPGLVRGQLVGRLSDHADAVIREWIARLRDLDEGGPWLAPLTPALTPTTTALRQVLTGHTRWVMSVGVSANGATAISGGTDGTLRVWDLATGRAQKVLSSSDSDPTSAVALTSDASTAVSGGPTGTIRVWDLTSGRERAAFAAHTGSVSSLAIALDETTIVSGGDDGAVRLWDLDEYHAKANFYGHEDGVRSVAISADGKRIVSGGNDGTVRAWDCGSGGEATVLTGHAGSVLSVAVTADGQQAISGGSDGTIRVWDLRTQAQTAILRGHGGAVLSIALTADWKQALSGDSDGSVCVWNLSTGTKTTALAGHDGRVRSVAVAGRSTVAVSGGGDGTVRVWDLAGQDFGGATADDAGAVWAAAIAPDASVAVSGNGSGAMTVWDLVTGSEQVVLPGDGSGTFSSLAITPDGTLAISGGGDGSMRIWNPSSGKQQELTVTDGWAWPSVAITPDGKIAASGGGDGSMRIWDLTASREEAVLVSDSGGISVVAVHTSGTLAVSGSEDGAVRLWDLTARREPAVLTGHRGWVLSVAVTGDGKHVISGGDDGTVRLWDVNARREQAVLVAHSSPWRSVAVLPDGMLAVSGSDDGLVCVWDLTTSREIARWGGDYAVLACALIGGESLRIGVVQRRNRPYVLSLSGISGWGIAG